MANKDELRLLLGHVYKKKMRVGTFFCAAENATAIGFCVCEKNPVYLCVSCVPKHKDKSGHEVFPMACLGLYKAQGYNKLELKKRMDTVNHCNEFLEKAAAREAAVTTEANSLLNDLVQAYQGWLEMNHCCFNNLVEILREETTSLLTTPEIELSNLTQILVERIDSLSGQEENILWSIPEEKSLKEITQHCNQALAKTRTAQQQAYDKGVHQALMNLPVQHIPAQLLQAPLQMIQTSGQQVQQFPAPPKYGHPLQMGQAPGQQVQQFPAPRFPAQPQMFRAPGQEAKYVVQKKKCAMCSAALNRDLFFLQESCGCNVCVYCLVELVRSNNGVCLCNSYVSSAAIQKASQYMIRCSTCAFEKSLVNEFTPVKCADHMSCRKCLAIIFQNGALRCLQCHRNFTDYEVQQVKLYIKKQCMLYCQNYFDPENLAKTDCDCVYCLDCVKIAIQSYDYYNGCFICHTPFPKLTSDLFENLYSDKTEICKVCLDSIKRKDQTLLACGHQFHLQCIKDYASNFISTNFQDVIPCPDGQCREGIDPNLLQQSFLSPQEYEKYAEKLVCIRGNLVECPNCRFEFEFIRNEERGFEAVFCRYCQYRFCRECKQPWTDDHSPRICRHHTILELITNLEAAAAGDQSMHVSQCPGCQTPYLKDNRSDHVKCLNPGCVEWCFKCSAFRAPILEHHSMWHRPDCPHYKPVALDNEPKQPKCPECKRLGRRCDPPPRLKVPTRFDLDEYPDFSGKV